MTQYEVLSEEGVDLNGEHYEKGHVFEFDAVPDHVQAAIDAGSIASKADDRDSAEIEIGNTNAAPGKDEASSNGSSDDENKADDAEEKAE